MFDIVKLTALLDILYNSKVLDPPNPQVVKPTNFNTCNPINTSVSPQYVMTYRSSYILSEIENNFSNPYFNFPPPSENQKNIVLNFVLDIIYNQTWNLRDLSVADLSSSINLAPNETLTLEFENSQRKVLEQSTMDSTEDLRSDESLTNDKEIINVMRSSTKNTNWNVGGDASISIAKIGSFGGGVEIKNSLTENSENGMESINDTTQKSANNLKLLHKIEVKGTTETIVKNRMQRIIKNPYKDRTLSVNVFQLMKKFSVETRVKEIVPSLIIDIKNIDFNSSFIQKNSAFLREALLDAALIEQLDSAIESITRSNLNVPKEAVENSKLALNYLFGDFAIAKIPNPDPTLPPTTVLGGPNIFKVSPDEVNYPYSSFDGGFSIPPQNPVVDPSNSAIQLLANEIKDSYLLQVFTILNFFYKIYSVEMRSNFDKQISDSDAIILISTLANKEVQELWQKINPEVLINVMKKENWRYHTEIIRRLPGFFTMVNHMVKPYMPDLELDSSFVQPFTINKDNNTDNQTIDINQLKASQTYYQETQDKNIKNSVALNTILKHLNCNKNYYIQQYLKYIYTTSHSITTANIAKQIIDSIQFVPTPDKPDTDPTPEKLSYLKELILAVFDFPKTFLNKQQLVIPAYKNASEETINKLIVKLSEDTQPNPPDESNPADQINFKFEDIIPQAIDVDVPTDGIHLEVTPGDCVLKGLSPNPGTINCCCEQY